MAISRERRIVRAEMVIVNHTPFFAPGVAKQPVVFDPAVERGCTDGKRVMVNPEWFDTLSDPQVNTLLAHEALHPMLGHLWRMPAGGNPEVWNMACDYVVNNMLREFAEGVMKRGLADPFPMPEGGGLVNPAFNGLTEEAIYARLVQQGQGKQPQPAGGQGNGQGGGKAGQKPSGKAGGQKPQPSGGKGGKAPQKGNSAPANSGHVPFGEFTVQDPSSGKPQKTDWQNTLLQAAKLGRGRGPLPAGMARVIGEVVNPQVPWYQLVSQWLREKANDDWNWQKPNTYYGEGNLILPVLESERIGSIVFATDTSGSINGEVLSRFQLEKQTCLDDLKPVKLVDIYCDAAIHRVAEYRPGEVIDKDAQGGGGTDFRPVFDWVDQQPEKPKCLVYLTDLYGTFPEVAPDYPVLWVTWTKDQQAPFGDTVLAAE